MRDNYETTKNEMQDAFLAYPQDRMISRFGLSHDEGHLYIRFFDRGYRIDRRSGKAEWLDESSGEWVSAGFSEAMTIYDVLCQSKEGCHPAFEWVSVSGLSPIMGGSLSRRLDFFSNAGDSFEGKSAELAAACERMGGRKWRGGDAAYELDMVPFLPVALRFYDSDDEYPASLQFFTDRNILDYMHYETLMYALSYLLGRLREDTDKSMR